MALKYVVVQRMIQVGASPGLKFLVKIAQDDVLDIWKVAEIIAETSALTKGDIISVLTQYETVLEWAFLEGNAVELGRMGKLVPGFSAKAVDSIEDANAFSIQRVYLRFSASKRFRQKLQEVKVAPQQMDFKGLQ